MSLSQIAIYARVSSDQQADAHTVASQVAALHACVAADGFDLPREQQFVDEGYSGATLVRPALERLRDLIASGGVDRLYVHSPDRLARKYAYQVLLIDEFQRAGVEVRFLNRPLSQSPEDELLLQVQGMIAEYERAKILERSRRGKRHAATTGEVSVLSNAPYGYRYVSKQEGGGTARFDIVLEEARVVRQVFTWIAQERLTIGEVCRRLTHAKETTRTGKHVWDRTTVWGMLKNPAYKGEAAFGKTRSAPLGPRLRAQRGRSLTPRRAVSHADVPQEEWISIAVPALVSTELFEAAQAQLQENRTRARQSKQGASYLLQGLLVCARCQYAYYGKKVSSAAAKGKSRAYAYYRCIGTDAHRFGGTRVCTNTQVRTDMLEMAVWQEVCDLLAHPQLVEAEYRRRLQPARAEDSSAVEGQLGRLRQGLARLIDSYTEGLIEKSEFEPRLSRLRQRVSSLETQTRELAAHASLQQELRLIIGRLEEFAARVKDGLEEADWLTKREIIRTLIKRVEIDQDQVNVVFRVGSDPMLLRSGEEDLQHCGRRGHAPLGYAAVCVVEEIGLQVACVEPRFNPFPSRRVPDAGKDIVVADRVEGTLDVSIQHPRMPTMTAIEQPPGLLNRVMTASPWAESIAVRLKLSFPAWFQRVLHDGLCDSVFERLNA